MQRGGNRQTEKLLLERSVPGRVGTVLPDLDVPAQPLPGDTLLRDDLLLPEVSEPEVVQYFTGLRKLNFSIDTHFYPLSRCPMQYNPKITYELHFPLPEPTISLPPSSLEKPPISRLPPAASRLHQA